MLGLLQCMHAITLVWMTTNRVLKKRGDEVQKQCLPVLAWLVAFKAAYSTKRRNKAHRSHVKSMDSGLQVSYMRLLKP